MRSKQQGEDLVRITIYVPEDLRTEIEKIAEKERRSLSQQIALLLERAVRKS